MVDTVKTHLTDRDHRFVSRSDSPRFRLWFWIHSHLCWQVLLTNLFQTRRPGLLTHFHTHYSAIYIPRFPLLYGALYLVFNNALRTSERYFRTFKVSKVFPTTLRCFRTNKNKPTITYTCICTKWPSACSMILVEPARLISPLMAESARLEGLTSTVA